MSYLPIYTIGCESLSLDDFFSLLAKHNIQEVIDVRSETEGIPCSKQLSRRLLEPELKARGIRYRFAGEYLGWNIILRNAYSEKSYNEVSRIPDYEKGINRLLALAKQSTILILGLWKEPKSCYRHKFIARSLIEGGCEVYHIISQSTGVARIEKATIDHKSNCISLLKKHQIERLYRIDHMKNLRSILEKGILCKNRVERLGISYRSIANPEIQERRKPRRYREGKPFCLHDYVPCFLSPRPPMLYEVKHSKLADQRDVIYLSIDAQIMCYCTCIFSDGNAASEKTRFYFHLDDLDKIDWDVVRADIPQYGDEQERKEWKRKKSAEVLVKDKIPVRFIKEIYTYDADAKRKVLHIIDSCSNVIPPLEIKIHKKWYF